MEDKEEKNYEKVKFPFPYIVLDGPSGTGKTTALEILRTVLPTYFIGEESDINQQLQSQYLPLIKVLDNQIERAELFVEYRSRLFNDLVDRQPQGAILGRGEVTTTVYQGGLDHDMWETIYQRHRQSGISVPDLVVILNCNPSTIHQRLQARNEQKGTFSGNFTVNTNRDLIYDSYNAIGSFLDTKSIHNVNIQSDEKTPIEVVLNILDALLDNSLISQTTYKIAQENLSNC